MSGYTLSLEDQTRAALLLASGESIATVSRITGICHTSTREVKERLESGNQKLHGFEANIAMGRIAQPFYGEVA